MIVISETDIVKPKKYTSRRVQTTAISSSRAVSWADRTTSEWLIRLQNDWQRSKISLKQCDTCTVHNSKSYANRKRNSA